MARFAHFDARSPVVDALCLSAFLVSIEEGLLVGRMRDPEAWATLDAVQAKGSAFQGERWVLPASHLVVAESPDAAARRIATEQLGGRLRGLTPWRVLSFAGPLASRDEATHWDLCFVYQAEVELAETPPWFAELRRVPLETLRPEAFARGHGEVLEALHLLEPP